MTNGIKRDGKKPLRLMEIVMQRIMPKKSNNHICVLKTGKILEHDIAANALTENNIPFFKQMETSSGLILAKPFQPSMGPGTFYNLLVPKKFSEKAKQILSELPIDMTENPGLFHFGASDKQKIGWKIFAWLILAITAMFFFANIIKYIS